MTYREALREFKTVVWPSIVKYSPQYEYDKAAKRSSWVDYVDQLHRGGAISNRQADIWGNPFSR